MDDQAILNEMYETNCKILATLDKLEKQVEICETAPTTTNQTTRKLARLVQIASVTHHPDVRITKIQVAQILGYSVAVGLECKQGDFGVFFESGSVLPPALATVCNGVSVVKSRRISTVISEGYFVPLAQLVGLDLDLTSVLGVEKLVDDLDSKHVDSVSYCKGVVNPPPKTDEPRLQSEPQLLQQMIDTSTMLFVTEKMHGTSATYALDSATNKLSISSRKQLVTSRNNSTEWFYAVAEKYNLESLLQSSPMRLVIQGEICGPKINGNPYKLDQWHFYVFSVWNCQDSCYVSLPKYSIERLEFVPLKAIIAIDASTLAATVKKELNTLAAATLEGVVVRNWSTDYVAGPATKISLAKRLSFKLLNPDFKG